MGLDGISINQLRITPEFNSAELNNINSFSPASDVKIVDGLSEGQKVDPDKESHNNNSGDFFGETNNEDETHDDVQEEVVKYDLSQTDKYLLKINDDTNDILITEKATNKVVEKINAKELSKLVYYLANSQGAIVNRKF